MKKKIKQFILDELNEALKEAKELQRRATLNAQEFAYLIGLVDMVKTED